MLNDNLRDFPARDYAHGRITKTVYVSGRGPAVVVMTEMPGISPDVLRFARWIREAGFTVYLPSLFGTAGAYPETEPGLAVLRRTCVSREFRAFAGGGSAPITGWLRALARTAHNECGGPGVGAIGMCFTGNFALTMTLEPSVIAPVVCQPSLPLDDPAALDLTDAELAAVVDRFDRDDLTVLGFRFAGDRHCRAERFATYRAALGDRFVATTLDDVGANPSPPPFFAEVVQTPHSVVTAHLVDRDGEPTIAARDQIITFLQTRLQIAQEGEAWLASS